MLLDIPGNSHDTCESESQVSEGSFLGFRMGLLQNDSSVWRCSTCCEKDVDETLVECNSQILECECDKTLQDIPGILCDTGESES